MNVLIFGSTGATGQHLVRIALARGHGVTAFVRDPSRLQVDHPALRHVVGDVMDAASVRSALPGHEAVLCALGTLPEGAADKSRRQPGVPVCSVGTRNILAAMVSSGCARIVLESSASAGESYGAGRWGGGLVVRGLLKDVMADKELQEAAVRNSPLDWTIVRPCRLTNGPARGQLQAGETLRWSLWSRAPRADVASYMVAALTDARTSRKAITLKA